MQPERLGVLQPHQLQVSFSSESLFQTYKTVYILRTSSTRGAGRAPAPSVTSIVDFLSPSSTNIDTFGEIDHIIIHYRGVSGGKESTSTIVNASAVGSVFAEGSMVGGGAMSTSFV